MTPRSPTLGASSMRPSRAGKAGSTGRFSSSASTGLPSCLQQLPGRGRQCAGNIPGSRDGLEVVGAKETQQAQRRCQRTLGIVDQRLFDRVVLGVLAAIGNESNHVIADRAVGSRGHDLAVGDGGRTNDGHGDQAVGIADQNRPAVGVADGGKTDLLEDLELVELDERGAGLPLAARLGLLNGTDLIPLRSEERRVGKEGRYRWSPY